MPFHNLGLLLGLFSPRCADLWPATRQEAVSCVYSLLYLQLGYEGEPLAGQRCRGCGEGAESGPLEARGGLHPALRSLPPLQASPAIIRTMWLSSSSPSRTAWGTLTPPSSSTPATA